MSFSSNTKDELVLNAKISGENEKRALICAVTHAAGSLTLGRGGIGVQYITENSNVAKLTAKLASELYKVTSSISISEKERLNSVNNVVKLEGEGAKSLLQDAGCLPREDEELQMGHIPPEIIPDEGCARCFLRGVFLGAGSVNDPSKGYHLEMVCRYEQFAAELCGIIHNLGVKAKYSQRKSSFMVYIKEGEMVSDFLALVGAMNSTLEFAEARVVRSVNNEINRRQNFEDANMNKAAAAAAQQLIDIEVIRVNSGLESLPPKLREAAEIRINNPEATLSEVAELAGISKSGLNHRLSKISAIAREIRNEKGSVI